MSDASLLVLLLTLELIIPDARSLKEKRGPLKSVKERLRSRFNASVAEVAYRDKWQRSVLAVCMVGSDRRRLQSEAEKLCRLVEEIPEIQMTRVDRDWL